MLLIKGESVGGGEAGLVEGSANALALQCCSAPDAERLRF